MNLISRDELRAKLERGDDFKLLMVLSANAYSAKHIPGSLHFATWHDALAVLDPAEEIVVYCAGVYCAASIRFYSLLERSGYTRVRRYAGGVADWEAAGYPIASETDLEVQSAGLPADRISPRATRARERIGDFRSFMRARRP
ncbi:MAG: rhodanese-like domain-containing protein [Solirubrobacterales bacterium]|nr:rhodanese-like domain-containing protein [Solirubrobacterales bacterium]MBV9311452.1 rhodanese-like domain-containing protein [Solirubrobacterales bacterium]